MQITVERIDPVTGEKTVTTPDPGEFMGMLRFPEKEHKQAYLRAYGKARKVGKGDQEAKFEASEVVRKMYVAEAKGEEVPTESSEPRPTAILLAFCGKMLFWLFCMAVFMAALGLVLGIFVKCLRWAMGI